MKINTWVVIPIVLVFFLLPDAYILYMGIPPTHLSLLMSDLVIVILLLYLHLNTKR